MGSVATELTLEELVVVSESLEPYVLTYHPQSEEEGAIEVTALVVLKREKGLLLALPPSALSQEVLTRGKLGHAEDVFGPSAIVTVPGVILDGGNISATGTSFEVLLIDCLSEVVHSLREYRAFEEIIYGFEDGSSFSLPDPVEITAKALAWVETVSPVLERVGFYSALEEEVAETPRGNVPLLPEGDATPRRRKPGQQRSTQSAKPKKVTTADLATSMEGLLKAIPALTMQVEQLQIRQQEFEQSLSTTASSGRLLGSLAKSIPAPPRTQPRQAPGLLASPLVKKPAEILELENEKTTAATDESSLARAVLAQSQALTTLVTQIAQASGDPMSDLSGSGVTPGSRGAMGQVTIGTGCTSWDLFHFSFDPHSPSHESDFIRGVISKGTFGARGEWREVLGEIWRLWQAERPWLPSVPGHADFRLPHGREPHGCSRLGHSPGYHPGADEHGWWSLGLGGRGVPSRRPTGIDLPDATLELHQPQPCLRTTSRSEASNSGIGVSQRTRRHPEQAPRAGGGSASKGSNSGGWSAKAEAKRSPQKAPKVEGEGRHSGGGLDDDGASAESDLGEKDGSRPNPLTSSTTFLQWAISLPRWILRSRTAFSWSLRTSFTAKWQRRSLPTTCLPLPAPHPGCLQVVAPSSIDDS